MKRWITLSLIVFSTLSLPFISKGYTNKEDSLTCLIEETKDPRKKVQLLIEKGKLLSDKLEYDRSINILTEALNIARWNTYNGEIGACYKAIGNCYYYKNNYSKALENYFLAIDYFKKVSNNLDIANCYVNASRIFNIIKAPRKAIYYNKKGVAHLKEKIDSKLLIHSNYSFSESYKLLNKPSKQLAYLKENVTIHKKKGDLEKLGVEYGWIGLALYHIKQYDSAIIYFKKDLKISIQINDTTGIVYGYNNIGINARRKKEYLKALEFFNKGLSYRHKNNAIIHLQIIFTYLKLKNIKRATYYFEIARKENFDLSLLTQACDSMAKFYRIKQDRKNLIHYLEIGNQLQKQLNKSTEQSKAEVELSAKLKYEVQTIEERMRERAAKALKKQKEDNLLLKANLSLQNKYNYSLGITVALLIIVITGIVLNYKKSKVIHRMKTEQLEKESLFFQYESIKNQVSPHFLFNCLNVLIGLLYESPEQSARFVKKMAEVYRYVLKNKNRELVNLETELEFIEAFIYLLKIKFGNNLIVKLNLPDTSDISIPPLTLQMLIENAIKHNTFSKEKPLKIEIFMEADYIVVSNNIQFRQAPDEKSGIGLENLRQRFKYLTAKQVLVNTDEQEFTIKVPQL